MQDPGNIRQNIGAQSLTDHANHFGDVVIRLPEKDDVTLRIDHHDQRNGNGKGGGFIAAAVSLQRKIPIPIDDFPNPTAVQLRQVLESDQVPDPVRVIQEFSQVLPGQHTRHPTFSLQA